MEILQHIHSIWRWVVVVTAVIALTRSIKGYSGKLLYTAADKKAASLFAMSLHIQLLIGISLLVFGGTYLSWYTDESVRKIALYRFFALEHPLMMFIAAMLATIGNARAKRAVSDVKKHQSVMVFSLIAVIIILAMIPWPFMQKFAATNGWF